MPNALLESLFPEAPAFQHRDRSQPTAGFASRPDTMGNNGPPTAREEIPTRWAAIYALELRGLRYKEIAEALNIAPGTVSSVTTDPRYLAYRERHLSALDQEFVAMKPLAFAALTRGLNSSDENTALRASEQWFKGASYGGYSRTERTATTLTAEDIARQLLGTQVNVQVNINTPERVDD